MTFPDFLPFLAPRILLAIAIGFSIVAYAVGSNAAKIPSRYVGRDWERSLSSAGKSPLARALTEFLRWLYYLGLPYVTLISGLNTVHALGVWNLEWITPLPYAVGLGIGAGILLLWVWRPYARAEEPHPVDSSQWSRPRHLLEVVYQQAHWAFYRSGPVLWLDSVYWGSFVGLALVYLEGWSNPNVRASARDIARVDAPLWTGSLAIVSALVFVFTQNTWYSFAIQVLLDLGLRYVIGFPVIPVPRTEETAPLVYADGVEEQPRPRRRKIRGRLFQ